MKVCFTKEDLANRSKEDLQKTVERCIEEGLCPPGTTVDDVPVYDYKSLLFPVKPVYYMDSSMLEGLLDYVKERDLLGLGLMLKSIIKVVDVETIERIQQLVEKEESK